ncbi:hypothetical protein CIW52_08340 [Mycolicibacterium sp. P9-64]|nr:hypothetical protein CIW52_08340 [Mycolicibacterium sp. P9-64]
MTAGPAVATGSGSPETVGLGEPAEAAVTGVADHCSTAGSRAAASGVPGEGNRVATLAASPAAAADETTPSAATGGGADGVKWLCRHH